MMGELEDAEISEDVRISPLYCRNCGKHAHIGPCGAKKVKLILRAGRESLRSTHIPPIEQQRGSDTSIGAVNAAREPRESLQSGSGLREKHWAAANTIRSRFPFA
jgi:hypothetical protein